ncbi:MAG: ATP-binding protein [Chloroflexota bacterium]|nr:ATP-binding protein [Chloroflexota bacterium]
MLRFLSHKRFFKQLILIFMLFTLGTIIGLGVPAAWLIKRGMDTQLHALIDQSNQTTLALFSYKKSQIMNLTTLLIERPTLQAFVLESQDTKGMETYLESFRINSGMDAISICNPGGKLALAGDDSAKRLCEVANFDAFQVIGDNAWLLSTAALTGEEYDSVRVVVGILAESILEEFSLQSGLDYVLFSDAQIIAANNPGIEQEISSDVMSSLEMYQTITTAAENGTSGSYMVAEIPLPDQPGFDLIGLRNIDSTIALNRQLRNLILITLVSISLIGLFAAVFLSRRISRPLSYLARSAASLREGDLTTPLTTSSTIWEIDQLTNALEDARVGLKHSLDELSKDKAWIENLLNAIVEGIVTIDERSFITFASEGIERILGLDAAMIMGRSIDDYFITQQGEDSFSQQIPGQNQGCRILISLDGRELLLNVSASSFVPPGAGNATRALVIRDVTDEERIHKLIGEFMANITHEFRTPLTALSASVELLLDDLPNLSNEEIGQLLHALNIGIIDLQSLIDNLIQAASIEAGRFKVNPQEVELSAIIMTGVNTIQPLVMKHGLTINYPKEKQSFLVKADKRRTVQALINLLSNAIKHSPDGGIVTVTTLILENEVLVEVQDEGQGVSSDRQAQLFNRFVAPISEKDFSEIGLGLGLSVVKAVVEAQGGKVGFKESESGSAIFWFTLPLVRGRDL